MPTPSTRPWPGLGIFRHHPFHDNGGPRVTIYSVVVFVMDQARLNTDLEDSVWDIYGDDHLGSTYMRSLVPDTSTSKLEMKTLIQTRTLDLGRLPCRVWLTGAYHQGANR